MTKSIAEDVVVSLAAEEAAIGVRQIKHGLVRVTVQTTSRDETVSKELAQERVEVTRIPMDRVVAEAPPVREEGDTTIISVVEEIVVIERRLMLKEEVHLRRVRTTAHHTEVVALRQEHAVIERFGPEQDSRHRSIDTEAYSPVLPTLAQPTKEQIDE